MLHGSKEQLVWLRVMEEWAQVISIGVHVSKDDKNPKYISRLKNPREVTNCAFFVCVQPFF